VATLAARESRPTRGRCSSFESSRAPAHDVPLKSANKRVSHLAEISEDESLGDRFVHDPFARATP
jgi:hypothetical protein